MSARYYGPDETWPSHDKQRWRETLDAARAAGWTLIYLDAPHWFGKIVCPGEPADRHTFRVGRTGKGGETPAIEAGNIVHNCQHGLVARGSKVQARREECGRLLDEAERLIGLADTGLTEAEALAAAWAELSRIKLQLKTAEASVAEVLRGKEEAALRAALEVEDAPGPAAIGSVLDEAGAAAGAGESVALKIHRAGIAGPLRRRAHAANARIEELRRRLQALGSTPGE